MTVLDQLGRTATQFDIIASAIATPIDIILGAYNALPPSPFPLSALYLNVNALSASFHPSFVLGAILVLLASAGNFLINLLTLYIQFFWGIGLYAGSAFGIPVFGYVGATIGAMLQFFVWWYIYIWISNVASQSPFFNAFLGH